MSLNKFIEFNLDQAEHVSLVQSLILDFYTKLMKEALVHDASKLSKPEYSGFIDTQDSLKSSSDGKDEHYQKALKGDAIHILLPHKARYSRLMA